MLPSALLPVAVNGTVALNPIKILAGVTVIVLGGATVSVAVPAIAPNVAVIVVLPSASGVAKPGLPLGAVPIVATPMFDELQLTSNVTSVAIPPLKLPVAVNCLAPTKVVGAGGATVMELTDASVTVAGVDSQMIPAHAVIVVVPADKPKSSPGLVTSLLICATFVFDEFHVTEESCCAGPLLKLPMAMNRCVATRPPETTIV